MAQEKQTNFFTQYDVDTGHHVEHIDHSDVLSETCDNNNQTLLQRIDAEAERTSRLIRHVHEKIKTLSRRFDQITSVIIVSGVCLAGYGIFKALSRAK